MYSSEVTPSVCTSTVSTISPMKKPGDRAGHRSASSPIDITTSGVMSALTPKIEICETTVSCTTTASSASSADPQRSSLVGTARPGSLGHLRGLGAGVDLVRIWTEVKLRTSAVGVTGTWPLLSSSFGLNGATVPIRIAGGYSESSCALAGSLKPAVTTWSPAGSPRGWAGPGGPSGSGCRRPARARRCRRPVRDLRGTPNCASELACDQDVTTADEPVDLRDLADERRRRRSPGR